MQALQRHEAKVNLDNVLVDISASLPARNFNETSPGARNAIFRHTDASAAVDLVTEDAALKRLRRLKKNRSPGVDGFTAQRLVSVFLGGDRNLQLRDDLLHDYVLFLKMFVAGRLTQHQLRLFHAIKLAAIPKKSILIFRGNCLVQ